MEATARTRRTRFGAYEVDLRAGEVYKHGIRLKLQDQPFQVLAVLLEHPGDVVTREELRQKLWPSDTFVDFDTGLNSAIKKLRDALSDSAEDPRYIETLPRRGYRFIAQVQNGESTGSIGGEQKPTLVLPSRQDPESVGQRRFTVIALVAALLIVASVVAWRMLATRPALKETDVILLANFVNRTGDPVFDNSLDKALEVKLTESPFLSPLPETDVRVTLSPGSFVVLGTFNALVVEILSGLPAFADEHVAEALHILHDARSFARADIQPDAREGLHGRRGSESQDDAFIPPNRRSKGRNFAKNLRLAQTEIERNQSTQRRAANAGVLCTVQDAIFALHQRANFFQEELGLTIRAATTQARHARGRVLAQALFARIVDTHNDERLHAAFGNELIRSLTDVPVHSRNEGSGTIEKILAIVEIKRGKSAQRLVIVARREIDNKVALVTQISRRELLVLDQVGCVHGAMTARRSLASTCCPGVTSSLLIFPLMGA